MSCGCHDTPLPLYNSNPCVTNVVPSIVPCTNGEPCENVIQDYCVKYTGPDLTCIGIHTNDRLDVIIKAIEKAICDLQTCCSYTRANCVTATITTHFDRVQFDWTFVSGATYDITIYDNINTVVGSATGLLEQHSSTYFTHAFSIDTLISGNHYTYEITTHNSCGSTTCDKTAFTPIFSDNA